MRWHHAVMAWFDGGPWLRAAPMDDRCIMGSTISPAIQCRRWAVGRLFCSRHAPVEADSGSGGLA